MLDAAVCVLVRPRQRLGSECRSPPIRPRPGKASGGWGVIDAPPSSENCSLRSGEKLIFYGQRGVEVGGKSRGAQVSASSQRGRLRSGDGIGRGLDARGCAPQAVGKGAAPCHFPTAWPQTPGLQGELECALSHPMPACLLGYPRVGAGGPVVGADCGTLENVWTWSLKA